MRWKVLVTAPYMQPVLGRFEPIFREHEIELVVPPVEERMEEAALLAYVGDIDGAICGDDRFTARVLAAAPRLKVISKWGTGIDSIDRAACQERGIRVCNTSNAFSEPVADTVMGYILSFARNLPAMDAAMKDGRWQKMPGVALNERTLGVIGVGDVGRAVIRRAAAFGVRVLANDIRAIDADFVARHGLQMVSKEALFAEADYISIHCDLNPTSHYLINAAALDLMQAHAILINTARGPIVDESALIAALESGGIGGAALDVFEHEPLPADSPLRGMSNVLLAPHNANASPQAWEHVHRNTVQNLLDGLKDADAS